MSFYAFLEIDNSGMLSIDDESGINLGTPLTAFLETYYGAITHSEESTEFLWFTQLEKRSWVNFRILANIIYGEDMLYTPNEYDLFLADWGRIYGEITEAEFKKKLKEVEEMWMPIEELIQVTEELLLFLPEMGEGTHWFTVEDTIPAFKALFYTLKEAQRLGGTKARILVR